MTLTSTNAAAVNPRIDLLLQGVGVGHLELGQQPPVEHQPGDFDPLRLEPLELALVGRVIAVLALAPALEAEPVVEPLPPDRLTVAARRQPYVDQVAQTRAANDDLEAALMRARDDATWLAGVESLGEAGLGLQQPSQLGGTLVTIVDFSGGAPRRQSPVENCVP